MTAKTKPIKPRRMWMVTRENGDYISIGRTKSHCGYSDAYSVIVLPADPASREAMVEKVAEAIDPLGYTIAIHPPKDPRAPWYDYRAEAHQRARAALAAVGVRGSK